MPEKFDFSKIEDQKKFEKLQKEEQDKVSDEVQEEEAAKMQSKIGSGDAKNYSEAENLVDKERQEMIEDFIYDLQRGMIASALEIKNKLSLSEEFISSAEVQQAAKAGLINRLIEGKIDIAVKIKNEFDFSKEIISSPEIQEAAKDGLVRCLNWCNVCLGDESFIDNAFEVMKQFNLNEKIIFSEEVQKIAERKFKDSLNSNQLGIAIKIRDKFSLLDNIVQDIVKNEVITRLTREYVLSSIDSINKIMGIFSSSIEEVLSAPEIKKAAENGLMLRLKRTNLRDAIEIKRIFNLSEEFISSPEVQQIVKEKFVTHLVGHKTGVAIAVKDNFSLSEEFVQNIAKEKFIYHLSYGRISDALEIKDNLSLPERFISSPEVQQAAKDGFIRCLATKDKIKSFRDKIDYWTNNALEIKNKFSIQITSREVVEKIPALDSLLKKLQQISYEFHDKALNSFDLVILLNQFAYNRQQSFIENAHENPFLLDAVAENLRFGSKLLVKFSQFDKLSQENIKTLFDTKKEILASNPEINPESLEFRQLMQEKLKGYENNPEILKELEKQGIDVNEWLNYSETRYFNLESGGSHLAFSETVSAPIDRIKETLDSYGHTLKEVLKQYRPELSKFKIPLEDTKEIEEKIAQMQVEMEKAKSEGNEKKAQGIERGIEGLKKKIENIKTVALRDKLLGDISAFQQLKNDVFQAQENLIKAENDLQEKLSGKMPSGRIIQELKEKISKSKEELRSKFGVLEKRIDYFKDHLWTTLSPCLGDDTTGALMQEIQTNLAEQFDHYDEDRSTLSNLFSEKTDREKGKMENQPMSIFVWARNPDVDLYQGNYSPCCIRIDSEHMGAESTIADYNTDLGIQIVNILDETKNEPVTAAWCWIGKNAEGETALIVDNIESNTLYSANYSEQLSKELFDYLKDYAKSSGVKKVVLGKANNDLPTSGELAKMKDDENKYEKVGGYNRPDGYFLEAENKNVKLLWENLEPIEKVIQKVEKVAKVEFKDLNIKNLSEKDFEKIKKLEKKIYKDTGLTLGQAMIEDMKKGNGLVYSIIASGKRPAGKRQEAIGYLVAMEDETDEGDPCIYLEDIALLPEAQGQQIGWDMLKNLIAKLKEKAKKENKPVFLDMHLRETSQRFFERYQNELEQMGVKLIEEALVPDYYDEDEDALYKVYEISPNNL